MSHKKKFISVSSMAEPNNSVETIGSSLNSTCDSICSYRAELENSDIKKGGLSNLTIGEFSERCQKILRSLRVQEKTSLDSIRSVNDALNVAFTEQQRRNRTNEKLINALST